ncbi:MAG: RIP metalloprotease RseP [Paracoccaceae bacterium]
MDLIALIPSFGNLLFTLGAFVIAILIIISIHEFGHYIVGRWTGIHAEVFSLGFGRVLWSRVDKHGTKWQLAAIPFGGYVKFLGDANAASGKDGEAMGAMSDAERRHTMHGAPLWARSLTVAAGPVFNFILSIIIFACIVSWRGVAMDPLTIDMVQPSPYAQELQSGDKVLAIGGQEISDLSSLNILLDNLPDVDQVNYDVLRGGDTLTVTGLHPFPATVAGLTPQSAALKAGVKVGDVILTVNGEPVPTFASLRLLVGQSEGKELALEIWRHGDMVALAFSPVRRDIPLAEGGFETRWMMGISGDLSFVPTTQSPGFVAAVKSGYNSTSYIISASLSGLYHVATGGISTCNLSGPVTIAKTSGYAASQGVLTFLSFVAFVSTAVGLMNLFPIPVLDGGHLVFHAYEAITGRPPKDGVLQKLMMVGLVLIIGLMVFALTNDFVCP